MKPRLRAGEDQQVARVQVGVEEAVLEEHADDARGAQVDQPVALLVASGSGVSGAPGLYPLRNSMHSTPRPLYWR